MKTGFRFQISGFRGGYRSDLTDLTDNTRRCGILLLAFLLCGAVFANELPGQTLKRPMKVHVARGLWWQMLKIHEAVGLMGGAEFSKSMDVHGSPGGYHACGRAMATFPHKLEQMNEHDVMILAGSRVKALRKPTQDNLVAWVNAGGGLLITGGPLSLDQDKYQSLAGILPVTISPAEELEQAPKGAVLKPASGNVFKGIDWSASPRVYWYHAGVSPQKSARVLMTAGDRPVLTIQTVGKGKVAVFSGTVCGDPAEGELAFWDWELWPKVLSMVLSELAPSNDVSVPLPLDATYTKALKTAKTRLDEIGEAGMEGLIDEDDEENEMSSDAKLGGDTGKELAEFARLTRDRAYAQKMITAIIDGNSRLKPDQAEVVYDHVHMFIDKAFAQKSGKQLLESTSAGTISLGLRLSALGGDTSVGPKMVHYVAKGLAGIKKDDDMGPIAGEKMGVPDGKDEGLRLNAAHALAQLQDRKLIASTRQAMATWEKERSKTPSLAERQGDVDEMIQVALAAMGDGAAASWVIDRYIHNETEREAKIDKTEFRSSKPSPKDIRERKQAVVMVGVLTKRIDRIRTYLSRIPESTWSAIATKSKDWDGEFATEALLLLLSEDGTPAQSGKEALKAIRGKTPIQAVRRLCEIRSE